MFQPRFLHYWIHTFCQHASNSSQIFKSLSSSVNSLADNVWLLFDWEPTRMLMCSSFSSMHHNLAILKLHICIPPIFGGDSLMCIPHVQLTSLIGPHNHPRLTSCWFRSIFGIGSKRWLHLAYNYSTWFIWHWAAYWQTCERCDTYLFTMSEGGCNESVKYFNF